DRGYEAWGGRTKAAGQTTVEAAAAAAVRGARYIVSAHVLRQRDVFLRVRAHPFWRELELPDFGRAEVLDHLRAGTRFLAAVQDAALRPPAHLVLVLHPPLRAFAARLVELQHAVGLSPAEIERDAPAGDDRPHAVVHLAPRLVLIESEVQPASQEVARLRNTACDAVGNRAAHGVPFLLGCVLEERSDIPPRGEADAEDVRILPRIHDLIELVAVESAVEADLHRQGRQRHRCRERAAAAELPVAAGDDAL